MLKLCLYFLICIQVILIGGILLYIGNCFEKISFEYIIIDIFCVVINFCFLYMNILTLKEQRKITKPALNATRHTS